LRVFEAVVRHMSYRRTAEELHLSQPAVSRRVRQRQPSRLGPHDSHVLALDYFLVYPLAFVIPRKDLP